MWGRQRLAQAFLRALEQHHRDLQAVVMRVEALEADRATLEAAGEHVRSTRAWIEWIRDGQASLTAGLEDVRQEQRRLVVAYNQLVDQLEVVTRQ